MKILYDHQIFAAQKFGGISRYFQEIMKIHDQGVDVMTIDPEMFVTPAPVPGPPPPAGLFSRGARLLKRRLGMEAPTPEPEPPPAFPAAVSEIFAAGRYDIFHPTYYDPYFLERNRKPFVLTVYDMIHEIYKEYFVEDPASQHKLRLCQQASQVIAISEKTKEDLVNIFRIPASKVHAIPLASTFDTLIPQKPSGPVNTDHYILFVGNRGVYKNFYFALLSLAEILKNDRSLSLLCTGHPFSAAEINLFRELGIEQQLKHIYLYNDQELAWAYRNAALFIFPSLYEGFGFPLLEAFASGCPVITSNGGSLPEVAGNAALYFDPKNLVQIQEAAHTALYEGPVREELIRRGYEQFKLFSWEKCRSETLAIYRSVAGF